MYVLTPQIVVTPFSSLPVGTRCLDPMVIYVHAPTIASLSLFYPLFVIYLMALQNSFVTVALPVTHCRSCLVASYAHLTPYK